MSGIVKGVDVSYWSSKGPISRSTWRKFAADGVSVAVVGAHHGKTTNTNAQESLFNARLEGFITASYFALVPDGSGTWHADQAAKACGDEWDLLSFVAVDCEVDGITTDQIREAVDYIERSGLRAVIYTARWWWAGRFGNPTLFKDLPLWNAYWDKDPDFDFERAPYGGWTIDSVIGTQYTGSTKMHGITVDLDAFRADFVAGGPPPQVDWDHLLRRIREEMPSLLNQDLFDRLHRKSGHQTKGV